MKKAFYLHPFPIIMILTLAVVSCKSGDNFISNNRDRLFNEGWKFMRDSLAGAEQPGYDDSQWQTLDLPHDWSIAKLSDNDEQDRIGPFLKSSQGATSTGYATGGTAWYRKHLKLDKADAGKTVILRFDGVYMETEVWVNGKLAGNHVYGYTPFWFDITSSLNKTGEDNVIAVRVNNTGRNSRWYSGSGIYRNVYLTITDQVHISLWGVQVTTAEIKTKTAIINLAVTVQNDADKDMDASFTVRILAPGGKIAGMADGNIKILSREKSVFKQQVSIERPVLWTLSSPGLYKAEVTLNTNGKTADRFIQSFGIRSVEVTTEKGFLLNGNTIKLKGACMHHDNGLLGSAAFDRAEERRVEIMKANGFNAIRTSHNPPSEAFLNACDRLGMLVIDETFDCWERPKNPQDYHRYFKAWWKNDIAAMIMRDRNHPCVIMWSIGNEINERADTSGIRIAKSIISFIRQMDTTRPFTNAICEFWDNPGTSWESTANAFALVTVGGYNYQYLRYESDHEKFPGRIMMGTESVPKDAFENWQQVEKHPYVIGDFVWTGMDYLGETGIGHTQYFTEGQQDVFAMPWPWFNAWCGDIDIIGNKKPQMLYRDVIWGNSKLEINVHAPVPEGKTEKISYWGWPDEYPHWNWNGNEDKILQVTVYTKGTAVKLLLNGREIGYKEVSPGTKLMAIFDVPYEPGELKAVAYENDRELAVKVLKTSGAPTGIRLIADRNPVKADRNDLSYVTIEIIDEFGQVVTDASNQVRITLTGNGELAGSGNACPYDMKSIGKNQFNTFHGKAMAIIRPYAEPGTISLKAVSDGLKEGIVMVNVK
jgi:beta-galactosidase